MSTPITVVPVPRALAIPMSFGAGLTHRGMVREHNEDSILTDPSGRLWVVADGMGGHRNGAEASDIVIDCLEQIHDEDEPLIALNAQITEANRRVMQRSAETGGDTMGSTVVAMIVERGVAYVVWAGDSRAYLLRAGRLRLLTTDHTLIQSLLDRGEIDPDQAEGHPEAHIVTRAVGGGQEIEVENILVPLIPGDRLMLCSDGLPRCVYEYSIGAVLQAAPTPEACCAALISEAMRAGAPDNVSVIVVDLVLA